MPKIFTDENRDEIRLKLLNKGFKMLKKDGLSAVNIDTLTKETYIYCQGNLLQSIRE